MRVRCIALIQQRLPVDHVDSSVPGDPQSGLSVIRVLSQGHIRSYTTLWEHSYTSGTLMGPNWLRVPWPFLLYKVLYNTHPRLASRPLRSYTAIQRYTALYSAIQRYTAIQPYIAIHFTIQARQHPSVSELQ